MSQGDLFALASGFFWSFSVILMRVSGFKIGPIPLTFFKNVVAILCLLCILIFLKTPLIPDLSSKNYLRLMLSGVLGITIADTLFAAALNRLGASLQAIADCIYSPAIILVGFLLFGEMLGPMELVGGALVLAGVFVGSGATPEVKNRKDLIFGISMAATAHITMAFGILMVRDLFDQVSLVWISAYRFLTATIVLAILVLPGRRRGTLFQGFQKPETWKSTIPMSILGPFLATLCWCAGFKYSLAGRAAIYNQLSTVFIILLAWFFLKEQITSRKLIGVSLAVGGAFLVGLN